MTSLFRDKLKSLKGKSESKEKNEEPAIAQAAKDGVATTDSNSAQPSTTPAPLLDQKDEEFLAQLVSDDPPTENDDDGPPPPLPPRPERPPTPELSWDTDSDSVELPRAATEEPKKKPSRMSRIFRRKTVHHSSSAPDETEREWDDLSRALARLGINTAVAPIDAESSNASSKSKSVGGRAKAVALSTSNELQSLLQQFVVVLRDIMRGAPAATNDLIALLDGRNDVLTRGFDKLPKSMQKLVKQLPEKVTSKLSPELMAAAVAAAESQGLKRDGDKKAKAKDAKGLAQYLTPRGLSDLVLTPTVVKSMLKAIVNALKLRWPAFMGTSVLWSAAILLLLFVLWYCRKRGKEIRLQEEEEARTAAAEREESRRRSSGSSRSHGSRRSRDHARHSSDAGSVDSRRRRRS
jgi:hypothetical protein